MRATRASGRRLLVTALALGLLLLAADWVPAFAAARRQLWSLHSLAYQEMREKLSARPNQSVGPLVRGAADGLPAPAPSADPAPGRYTGPLRVALAAPPGVVGEIHYTLDGSVPTRGAPRYRQPIAIDSTSVLRWRVLRRGALPGEVATGTYLVEPDNRRLPLVGLTLDSLDLWGRYSGIYVRPQERGREFERLAHVSVVEADGHEVGFEAQVRIHGGYSRLADKKSFRLRFRSSAVAPNVTATDILRALPGVDEQTVVLRSSPTSAVSRLADALSTELYLKLGKPVSQSQPVRLTINGQYWGIYDLREYISPQFLASRFGPGPFELLAHDSEQVHRWLSPVEGTGRRWSALTQYIRATDLADPAAFDSAARLLDPDDMIDYWAHNVYAGNVDWPYNNAILWRHRGENTPYRFLFWDGDATFSSFRDLTAHNTLAWSLRDRPTDSLKWNARLGGRPDAPMFLAATEPMREFLENPGFRDAFIARLLTLLSTTYQPDAVLPMLERLVDDVRHERPYERERWGTTDSSYDAGVHRMQRFIVERPAIVRRHLAQHFGLGEERPLRVEVRGAGAVRLGGQLWRDTTVTLTMLARARIPVDAIADEGAALASPNPKTIVIPTQRRGLVLQVRFVPERQTP